MVGRQPDSVYSKSAFQRSQKTLSLEIELEQRKSPTVKTAVIEIAKLSLLGTLQQTDI